MARPRQDDRLVIPRFIRHALAGEPIVIYGDGAQTRDFVYVGDVAQANVQGLAGTHGHAGDGAMVRLVIVRVRRLRFVGEQRAQAGQPRAQVRPAQREQRLASSSSSQTVAQSAVHVSWFGFQ